MGKQAGAFMQPAVVDDQAVDGESVAPEVSIVMPCLNEADTLATCIEKARRALHEHAIAGEVIVADNGSTDGSQAIAARMGARVVQVLATGSYSSFGSTWVPL